MLLYSRRSFLVQIKNIVMCSYSLITRTHTHARVHANTHTHTYTHKHIHHTTTDYVCTHTLTHMRTHTHTHTCIHTSTRTNTRMHTLHIRTCAYCDGKSTKIPKRDFILRTCEAGADWHLIPCRISPCSESFLGHIGTGILCEG